MVREFSRRGWLAAGIALVGTLAGSRQSTAAEGEVAKPAAGKGTLGLEGLGRMVKSAGLKGTLREKAYDFVYTEKDASGEEWNLSMSAVLSNDEKSIWMMAWLDELPQSSSDVPRTALLRLLADNDMIGNGIFFAYVKSNRRFILQRVIRNENITATSFKTDLDELGYAVMNTYAPWSVRGWKQLAAPTETASAAKEAEADDAVKASGNGVSRTATREGTTSTGKSVRK